MLVSNSSTLILLAKISLLSTFLDNYNSVGVPDLVFNEISATQSYDAALIKKEVDQKRIIIQKINKDEYQKILQHFRLDEGEAATYALFNNKKHEAILTDDGELIKLCKLERIQFVCAMAVVIRLFEKKKISKEEAIDKLDKLHLIGRYSKELYQHFKSEVK